MNFITTLILLVLSLIVYAGQDYYKLLGVSRNADDKTIRRSFKKLSLKYHPDKNKDNSEQAKKKFAEIVNAYEVLKDPEQRKVYDQYGEEGLKEGKGRGDQFQGNFQDIFSHFFRGGGGGGGFNFQFNQGGNFKEDFFSQSDVFKLDMGSLSQFLRRREVWLIFFYKSNQQNSKQHKDLFRDLASKYYGIFKVAGVDCSEEEEICNDEFQVFSHPSVKAYPSNIISEGHAYNGDYNSQSLANFAVRFMENFVDIVRDSNYNDFIKQNPDKYKVLLFTQKKSTPPLYLALSKDLQGKLIFGIVRINEEDLNKKFNVANYPTLIVLTEPENYKGVVYEGGVFKKEQIKKFLREYAYFDSAQKLAKQATQDKKLIKMDRIIASSPDNCGAQAKNLCLLMIIDDSDKSKECLDLMESIAKMYKDDPIKFYYIHRRAIEFGNIFDEEITSFPATFIIKGKKDKYYYYESNKYQLENLKIFIDQSIGGSGQLKKLTDVLGDNVFDQKNDL